MPSLDFKGGQIAFDVSGKGPCVVLLHGFLETKAIWKDYSTELSKRYKVLIVDLPGHGSSSNFGYCHPMELMANAVMAVLKSMKIRRFYIVGHSMGGYVAMAMAELYPDNIKGLCLFHSTADSDSAQKQKERKRVIKVVQKNKHIFIRESIPNLFNTEHKPYKTAIASIIKSANKISVQNIIASLEGMRIRINRQIVLKFAHYPVLFIIGQQDRILPYKKLIEESKLSEYADYILLEDTGHMGFIENKQSCLQAINVFLKRPKV